MLTNNELIQSYVDQIDRLKDIIDQKEEENEKLNTYIAILQEQLDMYSISYETFNEIKDEL